MRRHLNTLYVTTENAWLHKDGENIVVKVDGAEQARVPIHLLGSVVCMGTLVFCVTNSFNLSVRSRSAPVGLARG